MGNKNQVVFEENPEKISELEKFKSESSKSLNEFINEDRN